MIQNENNVSNNIIINCKLRFSVFSQYQIEFTIQKSLLWNFIFNYSSKRGPEDKLTHIKKVEIKFSIGKFFSISSKIYEKGNIFKFAIMFPLLLPVKFFDETLRIWVFQWYINVFLRYLVVKLPSIEFLSLNVSFVK